MGWCFCNVVLHEVLKISITIYLHISSKLCWPKNNKKSHLHGWRWPPPKANKPPKRRWGEKSTSVMSRSSGIRVALHTTRPVYQRAMTVQIILLCAKVVHVYWRSLHTGLADSWADKVIVVQHISDRILPLKLTIGKAVSTLFSCRHFKQLNANMELKRNTYMTSRNVLPPRFKPLRYCSQLATGTVTSALPPICSVMCMGAWLWNS